MITVIIGNEGSGKSTLLAQYAKRALKKGKKVYSNFYLEGCYILDPLEDFYGYLIDGGVVIVDEAYEVADSREFKTFGKKQTRFVKMHRHYDIDNLIYATQDFGDIDIRIRNMTKTIIQVNKSIIPFCIGKQVIIKKLGISEDHRELVSTFHYKHWLLGGYKLMLGPLYWKMFNSKYRDKLDVKKWYTWSKETEHMYTQDYRKVKKIILPQEIENNIKIVNRKSRRRPIVVVGLVCKLFTKVHNKIYVKLVSLKKKIADIVFHKSTASKVTDMRDTNDL